MNPQVADFSDAVNNGLRPEDGGICGECYFRHGENYKLKPVLEKNGVAENLFLEQVGSKCPSCEEVYEN